MWRLNPMTQYHTVGLRVVEQISPPYLSIIVKQCSKAWGSGFWGGCLNNLGRTESTKPTWTKVQYAHQPTSTLAQPNQWWSMGSTLQHRCLTIDSLCKSVPSDHVSAPNNTVSIVSKVRPRALKESRMLHRRQKYFKLISANLALCVRDNIWSGVRPSDNMQFSRWPNLSVYADFLREQNSALSPK